MNNSQIEWLTDAELIAIADSLIFESALEKRVQHLYSTHAETRGVAMFDIIISRLEWVKNQIDAPLHKEYRDWKQYEIQELEAGRTPNLEGAQTLKQLRAEHGFPTNSLFPEHYHKMRRITWDYVEGVRAQIENFVKQQILRKGLSELKELRQQIDAIPIPRTYNQEDRVWLQNRLHLAIENADDMICSAWVKEFLGDIELGKDRAEIEFNRHRDHHINELQNGVYSKYRNLYDPSYAEGNFDEWLPKFTDRVYKMLLNSNQELTEGEAIVTQVYAHHFFLKWLDDWRVKNLDAPAFSAPALTNNAPSQVGFESYLKEEYHYLMPFLKGAIPDRPQNAVAYLYALEKLRCLVTPLPSFGALPDTNRKITQQEWFDAMTVSFKEVGGFSGFSSALKTLAGVHDKHKQAIKKREDILKKEIEKQKKDSSL